MQVHDGMDKLPEIPGPVVTVGAFDGVHAGHRVIINRLNQLAKKHKGSSVLITFYPHPRKVLYPEGAGKNLQLITTRDEKIRLLENAGLDHLVIMDFTLEFSKTSSDEFLKEYLIDRLRAHTLVVGFNHYFGHNKEGNYDSLYRNREKYAYQVEEIPEQEIQNETVSSTKIRAALSQGNVQRANAYLEHHFFIYADWVHRADMTANYGHPAYEVIIDHENKLLPPEGAYAVSLCSDSCNGKALVLITEQEVLLFPLECFLTGNKLKGAARFQKNVGRIENMLLDPKLELVRELVY